MQDMIQDVLQFYQVQPLAIAECKFCKKKHEQVIEKIDKKADKNSLPWVLFYKELYKLAQFNCCAEKLYATHIELRKTLANNQQNNVQAIAELDDWLEQKKIYKIGTVKVPVITDELLIYPVTRTWEEQINVQRKLQQQTRLLSRNQQAFYEECYVWFDLHFDTILVELDGSELADILDAILGGSLGIELKKVKLPPSVSKSNKKAYRNWVRKMIKTIVEARGEEGKRTLFFLIVKYFVEWELIQGIYYLRWNVTKYRKMIGDKMLIYMLINFPLTQYFEYLREQALQKLLLPDKRQTDARQSVKKSNGISNSERQKTEKLTQTVLRQKEVIKQLEDKAEQLSIKNEELSKQLSHKHEANCDKAQLEKIKSLQAMINELKQNLNIEQRRVLQLQHQLLSEQDELIKLEANEEQTQENKKMNRISECDKLARLKGKTVAIFGNLDFHEQQLIDWPFSIETATSVQEPSGINLMNRSDVLVVLTRQISHACMWTIKENAVSRGVPVYFSRHSNLEIILNEVAKKLQNK